MRKSFISLISIISLIFLVGCLNRTDSNQKDHGPNVADSIPADDSSFYVADAEGCEDSLSHEDTITDMHNPSANELEELQTFILEKLKDLKGNPLQQNICGIGLLPNAVEVYMAINTPFWHREFRKYLSDSPYVKFSGPSKPEPISDLVDSVASPYNIKLKPEKPAFSVNSQDVSFILTNESEENIDFGVGYVIGYKGEDGIWYQLPNPEFWIDLGISLQPTGSYTVEASMFPKLNDNKPGVYRLYKQIRFEGEKKKFWLMTEFILK